MTNGDTMYKKNNVEINSATIQDNNSASNLAEDLYFQGINLIKANQKDLARLCFEKCLVLVRDHVGAAYSLFIDSVERQNYKRAFDLLQLLITIDVHNKCDYNYSLYLLSQFKEPPKVCVDYIKHLDFLDVLITSSTKNHANVILQNKIRVAVMKRHFAAALYLSNYNKSMSSEQEKVERFLLEQAVSIQSLNKERIVVWLKNKRYDNIIKFLTKKDEINALRPIERYILKLVLSYVNMCETHIIPVVKKSKTDSVFKAIDNNNFKLALRLTEKHNAENNISNDENCLYIILRDINNFINELVVKDETNPSKDKDNEIKNISIDSVFEELLSENFDRAFKNLSIYMGMIGKPEYEIFIINLIKLCILDGDTTYIRPMRVLSIISKSDYIFDISIYLNEFHIAISENNLEEAKIYFDLIKNACRLQKQNINTDELLRHLNLLENKLQQKTCEEGVSLIHKEIVN